MAASNLRFGAHATREVGMDFTNMISQLPASERSQAKIGVFTDPNVAKLDVMKVVEESLLQQGLNYVIWDKVSVEPTDHSWQVGLRSSMRCRSLMMRTGCDRFCAVLPYHPLSSCRRRFFDGYGEGCQSVYQLPRVRRLRVHQCSYRSG